MGKERIALIGSGNWGSAISRLMGENVKKHGETFEEEIRMWVFEEEVNGRKLTEIINTDHENVKYLPGYPLPHNIVAVPELAEAAEGATLLVFCLPHQFLPRLLPTIKQNMASNARAISLIKGLDFDDNGPVLLSQAIREGLGVDVAVLMGANVANEVAAGEFCESTVGASDPAVGALWQTVFHQPSFRVAVALDPAGVEVCGALKNVVAVGAGLVDGLGLGGNTKAAIMRNGLIEMRNFARRYFDGVKEETFFESCGVADLITTCIGGRNRKCAAEFVTSGKSWEELEQELLCGQKLQGTLTAKEVHEALSKANATEQFPLMTMIYRIAYENVDPKMITQF